MVLSSYFTWGRWWTSLFPLACWVSWHFFFHWEHGREKCCLNCMGMFAWETHIEESCSAGKQLSQLKGWEWAGDREHRGSYLTANSGSCFIWRETRDGQPETVLWKHESRGWRVTGSLSEFPRLIPIPWYRITLLKALTRVTSTGAGFGSPPERCSFSIPVLPPPCCLPAHQVSSLIMTFPRLDSVYYTPNFPTGARGQQNACYTELFRIHQIPVLCYTPTLL